MRSALLSILAALALLSSPALARTDAFIKANVNLRAGPGTEYPILFTAPSGSAITLLSCLEKAAWCEVEAKGERGWISGRYLRLSSDNRTLLSAGAVAGVPTVTFNKDIYWRNHYQNKPFYK